jgi:hypothetical protein
MPGMGILQDIIDLYGKGGIEVATFAGIDETTAENDLLIRTVIQPNASLITWVRPGNETEMALERHQVKLQSHLQSIKDLRRRLNAMGWFLTIVSVLVFYGISAKFDVSQAVRLIVVAAAAFLFRVLFKYLVLVLFRRIIRQKLRKYFSPLTG